MSMKRSKESNAAAGDDSHTDGFFRPETEAKKWIGKGHRLNDEAFTLAPQQALAKEALVIHAKFGKGIVVDVEPSRVEVLFQDGPKKLAHGLS